MLRNYTLAISLRGVFWLILAVLPDTRTALHALRVERKKHFNNIASSGISLTSQRMFSNKDIRCKTTLPRVHGTALSPVYSNNFHGEFYC